LSLALTLTLTFKVILDRDELITKVDKYMKKHYRVPITRPRCLRGSPPRRQQYQIAQPAEHYPIADWDVSRVQDFTSVFSASRNKRMPGLDEDFPDGMFEMAKPFLQGLMVVGN
jgi:hypothetical protein